MSAGGRPLRIAQIAPPGIPCPPEGYGASELVVSNLTEELVRQGHEVTLFAHPESRTGARLVSFPRVYDLVDADQREFAHTSLALDFADRFDIVHNHCIAPGPSLLRLTSTPSLTTLHYLRPLLSTFAEENYVALSQSQARLVERKLHVAGIAPNGIDMTLHSLVEDKDDYLLFLGRIDPKKGVHLAMDAARALNMRLLIAAGHPTRDNLGYLENEVTPRLGGGIEHIGHVGAEEKVALLGRARAVLMPHQWEEPFGLVAVEALASGTPVIAFNRGALPEIIPNGQAGFIVEDLDGMTAAIQALDSISPVRCRQAVEDRFSSAAMAAAYLSIYYALLAPHAQPAPLGKRWAGRTHSGWARAGWAEGRQSVSI